MPDNEKKPARNAIGAIRERIDAIDESILSLLHERIDLAREIGRCKGRDNLATWDPARERQIFRRLETLNQGRFPQESLFSIFREIINTCRASQRPAVIAFLGPEGTFSHLAGIEYFGHSVVFRPAETIEDVFIEVERGRAGFGVVPVENSIEGAVTSTLDCFMHHGVMICGELNLAISHNLVNRSGRLEDVKTVVSHAQPLAQCRQWLKKNLPGVPARAVFSTAQAAQMAADDGGVAAVASLLAVRTYGLQTVVSGIEDYSGNTTRFLVISRESAPPSGADRTSLLVGLVDRPGALHDTLAALAGHGVNLTRIESRPVKGKPGNYLFFLDMLGHMEDENISRACADLRERVARFKWLGSYPRDNRENGNGR